MTVYHRVPGRIANLGFQMELPADWQFVNIPMEEVDFNQPAAFLPLAAATPGYAALFLTVAARPAYEQTSLSVWVAYLLNEHGIETDDLAEAKIGPYDGIAGRGSQLQDGMKIDFRFAFFEDGGRLVQLGLTGPEGLGELGAPIWQMVLRSFQLEHPMGQTAPVAGIGRAAHTPTENAQPAAWWLRAVELERMDRMDEAEELIVANAPGMGVSLSLAELYKRRMHRMWEAGNAKQAAAARAEAIDHAYAFASGATSGGEGAALSYQRDQFLQSLDARPAGL